MADRRVVERDWYYMGLAEAVAGRANCQGTKVGAVLVRHDRVLGTGFNGTPTGFTNCEDGGCLRCSDSQLARDGRVEEMSDAEHVAGRALDRCICVHAEQNALLTAARFGVRVEGCTMYATFSPCFGCLKEMYQAGVVRVVYARAYGAEYHGALAQQYDDLAAHLSEGDPERFLHLEPAPPH